MVQGRCGVRALSLYHAVPIPSAGEISCGVGIRSFRKWYDEVKQVSGIEGAVRWRPIPVITETDERDFHRTTLVSS
jgi:hypothetical protein